MRRCGRLTRFEEDGGVRGVSGARAAVSWQVGRPGDEVSGVTLAMETAMETAQTVCKTRGPAESASPLEVQNQRLQALVSELILDNQELRFKAAQLETELEKSERGMKAATVWAGMLF